MRHYCTLFDSAYLPKGLVLYESLVKHSSESFILHILPMEADCWRALKALSLRHVELLPVDSFEHDMKLTESRATRTHQEHCWACASNLCEYLMDAFLPEITYLDADMMFFSDPTVIFTEIGQRSIAVIPHRFIPEKKHLEVNGQFNVSWVTFKNTPVGRECVSTWAAQCRERCSVTIGCGDQLYLDEWPEKYGDDLCVIENIGAGLAPWNLANYQLSYWINGERPGRDLLVDGRRIVFYHYHEFDDREDGTYRLTNYNLRPEDGEFIYKPYMAAYDQAKQRLESLRLPA